MDSDTVRIAFSATIALFALTLYLFTLRYWVQATATMVCGVLVTRAGIHLVWVQNADPTTLPQVSTPIIVGALVAALSLLLIVAARFERKHDKLPTVGILFAAGATLAVATRLTYLQTHSPVWHVIATLALISAVVLMLLLSGYGIYTWGYSKGRESVLR